MNIVNKNINDIFNDSKLNSKFFSVKHNELNINCNILKDNFYLDSYNYFPITKENFSFKDVFIWGDKGKYENFYSKDFMRNFDKNKKNFKKMTNIFLLGSSPGNNYYRNLITFFPRIFFLNSKKVKLVVHRNFSNKFRDFILLICNQMKIEIQFIFLDDGFYHFIDSEIPQFLKHNESIKILNTLKVNKKKKKEKIYLSRRSSSYRNLINESDVIDKLKLNDFRIIDLNNINIFQQIELFSNAEVIVSPSGSSLANIVFCSPGTKIVEISPKYSFEYEDIFKKRYSSICDELDLVYTSIEADSVNLDKFEKKSKKMINNKVLNESNYYKNLLIRLDQVSEILSI